MITVNVNFWLYKTAKSPQEKDHLLGKGVTKMLVYVPSRDHLGSVGDSTREGSFPAIQTRL